MNDNLNALPVGSELNHYIIESVLGSGGFGIVYKAHHAHLEEQVVIKEFLPVELAGRHGNTVAPHGTSKQEVYSECLRRFMEEGRTLVKLRHPNVVRCRDLFTANGTAYLVMDFEDGLPLDELVRSLEAQGSRYSEQQLLHFLLPLADGLAYIHSQGVLHRDIKPANVFIRRSDGSPVIIDFGAAKQNFALASQSQAPFTEFYAPLEQIEGGGEAKPTVDIHAFGGLMYRLATGQMGPKAEARAMALVYGKPDPLQKASELAEGHYSQHFLTTIDQCLAFKANERPQTMDAVKAMLSAPDSAAPIPEPQRSEPVKQPKPVKQDEPIPPSPTNAKPFPLKPVAAVVLVALLGVAGWQYQQYSAEQERIATEKKRAEQQAKAQASNKQQQIAIAQQWLIKLGYTLIATGELDTRTKVAIQDFEKAEKLLVTSEVDATLLSKLEEVYWRKDKQAFDAAQKARTEHSYRHYLANWPDGKYLTAAEQGLADIATAFAKSKNAAEEQAKKDALARKKAEESDLWHRISQINDEKALNEYLQLYPNGKYRAQALSLLDNIQREKNKAILTIDVTPKDARVEFVDLKMDYSDRMRLPVGEYTIRVKKTGYSSVEKVVSLYEGSSPIQITLEKEPNLLMHKPVLNVGDSWTFIMEDGSTRDDVIVSIDVVAGRKSYKQNTGSYLDFDTLEMNSHPTFGKMKNTITGNKWPLKVGNEWIVESEFVSNNQNFKVKVNSKVVRFETISTKAGEFKCFVVESKSEDYTNNSWWCPDVKWVAKSSNGLELLSYNIQETSSKAPELKPIVRIEPRYPVKAARDGITGWVNLRFTVTENGSVDNIEVIGAEPAGIFDSEAIRALQRWKFTPKIENGKAVSQPGVMTKLQFKLE